jgi:2-polyprenyl-3-methyl-5-hydroxy-6-metoxy-1,4-benzoquinol methylase
MESELNKMQIPDVTAPEELGYSMKCPGCADQRTTKLLVAPDRFNLRKKMYTLVRCQECSLVWLGNPPNPDEMVSHYGALYDQAVSTAGESLSRFVWRREQLARYKQSGAVLDIGCSSGSFLYCMKEAGWDVFGIEMSERSASMAKQRCGAQVFVGDVLDAPFAEGSFDAITGFHVLEHMYQPREVMARIFRWLKPGGVFYMMVPNIDSGAARIFGAYWFALELPRHLYHFSPTSLRHMAKSVGLEEVSLIADREPFIENSVRYWIDSLLEKVGISRRPLAVVPQPGLVRRAIRKGFRLTLLPILSWSMRFAGPGESIHAVFRKPADRL